MNLLIVEDHPLVQEVLRSVAVEVLAPERIELAGTFAEALEHARERPDLVLLDLGLPDSSGLDTLKRFRKAQPAPRVVVLAEADDPASALASMQGGACGFLSKTYTRPVISAALQLIAAGGIYMPPLQIVPRKPAARRRDADLTQRQVDVLRLMARGLRNRQIAERLRIAEDTVKQHARVAYAVLGVSSRMEAVSAIARRGIRLD